MIKMGKIIYAAEDTLSYLKQLSKLNTCSTGLILGQSTDSKDYVVLLVRTPEQLDSEIQSSPAIAAQFLSVKDIRESWIADHAKHVTKMLPGGMWVIGVFICSTSNVFLDSIEECKAKTVLSMMRKRLSSGPLLNENSPSHTLLLHFNILDYKYCCKSFDSNNMNNTFQDVDWKFQNNYNKWCKLCCNFQLGQFSFGGNISCPVKDQLKIALIEINKNLEKAMLALNGQLAKSDDIVEILLTKMKLKELENNVNKVPCLKADIFIPYKKRNICTNSYMRECDVELHLLGGLASQVFINQKATLSEAFSSIKQDILRSLTARFEMHWDSLVEEEYGSPEEKLSVHEPPRKVSVLIPNCTLALNDYLFPGEGAAEVISSFKELLDIDINEANLEKELEMQGDPNEFYGKSLAFSTSSGTLLGQTPHKGLFPLLFSVAIILIAMAVTIIIQRRNENE